MLHRLCFAALLLLLTEVRGLGEVVYAVNCGGESHTDIYGIRYARDSSRVGTASDYGKQLIIGRVPAQDQIVYQTERYHTNTFGYDIPVKEDGWYLLVLKFSEVYFTAPNMKVFDVVLNGDLTIASDLDIFERVGRGVAHDEYIEFEVKDQKILYEGDESELTRGKMRVEFIKVLLYIHTYIHTYRQKTLLNAQCRSFCLQSYRDNPKVNAIVLMKGRIDDWSPLPPLPSENEDEEGDDLFNVGDSRGGAGGGRDGGDGSASSKSRNPSGPKTSNPYEMDDSSAMLPIFVAVGAFIPLLFCMCKL